MLRERWKLNHVLLNECVRWKLNHVLINEFACACSGIVRS